MKVLVTGASGFVGSHLIRALLAAGHSARGLSRTAPKGDRWIEGAEYVDGVDVGVSTTLTTEMFGDVDAVAHLIGIIQEGGNGQTFQRVHFYGTQNVLEVARRAHVPGPFLYVSAIGAAPDSPSEYSRTKFAAEQAVRKGDQPFVIVRPSLILGRDGEFVSQMEALVQHGGLPVNLPFPVIPVPGAGLNKFQPIFVEDLMGCLVKCLTDRGNAGKLYEVGGGSQVTFNDLIGGFSRMLHVSKPIVHAPIPVMKVVATVMEALMPKPPVTRDQLANLAVDNVTDSNAVRDVFGVTPLTFDQTLERIYVASGGARAPQASGAA